MPNLVTKWESLLLAEVEVLGVVVYDLRLGEPTSKSTCLGDTIEGHILGTADVVNLAVSLLIRQH